MQGLKSRTSFSQVSVLINILWRHVPFMEQFQQKGIGHAPVTKDS